MMQWLCLLFNSLSSPQPAEYAVYKPLLVLFGLVDALQKLLKVRMLLSDVCVVYHYQ